MLITILNTYNPLKIIQNFYTKKKKICPVLDFLKVKYHTKTKRKEYKDKSLHSPHSKY